jgi:hypothetical protein
MEFKQTALRSQWLFVVAKRGDVPDVGIEVVLSNLGKASGIAGKNLLNG